MSNTKGKQPSLGWDRSGGKVHRRNKHEKHMARIVKIARQRNRR